jgi:DNA-binding transcriptional MerR regulator
MSSLSIGQVAERFGLQASALRYYDERGLVKASGRRGGRRVYDAEALRRLALIQMLQRLGIELEVAASILDAPSAAWRKRVAEQMAVVDALLLEARLAREFLAHTLACPAAHPTRQCPVMCELLDRRVAGASLDELAKLYLDAPLPPSRPRRPRALPRGGKPRR